MGRDTNDLQLTDFSQFSSEHTDLLLGHSQFIYNPYNLTSNMYTESSDETTHHKLTYLVGIYIYFFFDIFGTN